MVHGAVTLNAREVASGGIGVHDPQVDSVGRHSDLRVDLPALRPQFSRYGGLKGRLEIGSMALNGRPQYRLSLLGVLEEVLQISNRPRLGA